MNRAEAEQIRTNDIIEWASIGRVWSGHVVRIDQIGSTSYEIIVEVDGGGIETFRLDNHEELDCIIHVNGRRDEFTPDPNCEHCDGEGTEVHMGAYGYYTGQCTHCHAQDGAT